MNSQKIVYLSKRGFKELKKAIVRLEHDRTDTIQRLREQDKTISREDRLMRSELLASIEAFDAELFEKKYTLTTAKLLPRKRDALRVALGSVVDLIDTKGRIIRYMLVDSVEANPSDGRISVLSPLGQSLVGKQMKDIVEWTSGLTTSRLQLIGIT